MQMQVICFRLGWLWSLTLALFSSTSCATFNSANIAKPGCPTRCGNVNIPYPFGIGLDGACSMGYWYNIKCDTSFNPPKPFLSDKGQLEILDISETQIRSKNFIASRCYGEDSLMFSNELASIIHITLTAPIVMSNTANMFTVVGCDDFALFTGNDSQGFSTTESCVATCPTLEFAAQYNGSCSGFGCCQVSVPKGMKMFTAVLGTALSHQGVSDFNPCGHAFIAEKDKFTFNVADFSDPTSFHTNTNNNVPVVYDWFVGANQTCRQAQQNLSSYVCQQNSNCTDFEDTGSGGYRCSCLPGYIGNPYLPPGCTDDNECTGPRNPCSNLCINTIGSYKCTCPKGFDGDGLKSGTGCTINSQFITWLSVGVSFVFVFLLMLVSWVYLIFRRRKIREKRKKFFGQNGGLLLEKLLPQSTGATETSNIFSSKELRIATKNYSKDCMLGKGGSGMVYKGVLADGRAVAIKKAKIVDQGNETDPIKEFVNEVVILTQVKHRNVVKLIGCCLETEVPLLAYEFISNGTLYGHIHSKGGASWLNWENCVRVASEAASALAYLHSAVSIPILHRDVKSANILVDESYTAKIADFGASRPKTIAETKLIYTHGYRDPESIYTNKLTEKSDVYSFGVVLAELLTKEKPVFSDKKMGEDHYVLLAGYFIMAKKLGRVMEILDHQLVSEAAEEQLVSVTNLVFKCLNLKGVDRPTMREVALELDGLRNLNSHPWAEQNHEDSTDLIVAGARTTES